MKKCLTFILLGISFSLTGCAGLNVQWIASYNMPVQTGAVVSPVSILSNISPALKP